MPAGQQRYANLAPGPAGDARQFWLSADCGLARARAHWFLAGPNEFCAHAGCSQPMMPARRRASRRSQAPGFCTISAR